jgi:hypothetical protein
MTSNILASFAEFEADIRQERQRDGIEKAKPRGVYKGRPATVDGAKVRELRAGGMKPDAIARELKSAASPSIGRSPDFALDLDDASPARPVRRVFRPAQIKTTPYGTRRGVCPRRGRRPPHCAILIFLMLRLRSDGTLTNTLPNALDRAPARCGGVEFSLDEYTSLDRTLRHGRLQSEFAHVR